MRHFCQALINGKTPMETALGQLLKIVADDEISTKVQNYQKNMLTSCEICDLTSTNGRING